jgi:hypothetical protein
MSVTINQLPLITTITAGDQIILWSTNNGDSRRASVSALVTFVTANYVVPLASGVSGVLPVGNGGTGVTTATGTGSVVLSASPTLATPTLTGLTNVASLNATGPVGIGVVGATRALQVQDDSGTTEVALFSNVTGSGNQAGISVSLGSTANNTDSWHLVGSTQTVGVWYLYGNGTTSYSSDERLKKNIVTARTDYLADVQALRVVRYNWWNDADGTPPELGLIAQEVEAIFPRLVQDAAHPTKDGINHKVLKSSPLLFILIAAVQELAARVEALEA